MGIVFGNSILMNCLELYSLIVPISLVTFSIDYLSDSQITNNETKIGILQLIHHLIAILCTIGLPICTLTNKDLGVLCVNVIVFLVSQYGWLYNKDYCFLTSMVNKLIDPKNPNRIWRSDLESFIKHYIRGDEWAYKDIFNNDKTKLATYVNIMLLINTIVLL